MVTQRWPPREAHTAGERGPEDVSAHAVNQPTWVQIPVPWWLISFLGYFPFLCLSFPSQRDVHRVNETCEKHREPSAGYKTFISIPIIARTNSPKGTGKHFSLQPGEGRVVDTVPHLALKRLPPLADTPWCPQTDQSTTTQARELQPAVKSSLPL